MWSTAADASGTKKCPRCKITKPAADFYQMQDGRLSNYCKKCSREINRLDYPRRDRIRRRYRKAHLAEERDRERRWRAANPDIARGALLRKYWPGSTWREALANFNAMRDAQGGRCAICRKEETARWRNTGVVRDLCVDHDHDTGRVRGLLCDACNVMLGRSGDDPVVCESAADYLRRSRK
jgi:hypothetical protein